MPSRSIAATLALCLWRVSWAVRPRCGPGERKPYADETWDLSLALPGRSGRPHPPRDHLGPQPECRGGDSIAARRRGAGQDGRGSGDLGVRTDGGPTGGYGSWDGRGARRGRAPWGGEGARYGPALRRATTGPSRWQH